MTHGEPGPGKYHAAVERLRLELGARAIVVAVIGGHQGHGLEVQIHDGPDMDETMRVLARVLLCAAEDMAEGRAGLGRTPGRVGEA